MTSLEKRFVNSPVHPQQVLNLMKSRLRFVSNLVA
jgi:hypothetical protein